MATGDDTETLNRYLHQLESPDPARRKAAATRLSVLEDPRAAKALIRALDDPEPKVRATAALALGCIEAAEAVPALLKHLGHDEFHHARAMCAFALGSIGTDEAMDGLAATLSDPHRRVRMSACSAFAARHDRRAVALIKRMLDDPEWDIRHTAADTLVILDEVDEKVVRTIEGLIDSPEAAEYEERMQDSEDLMRGLLEAPEWIGPVAESLGNPMDEVSEAEAQEWLGMAAEKVDPNGPWPGQESWSLQGLLTRARRLQASKGLCRD